MCRSIKQLRLPDRPATDAEIEAAALQFVRKVSGYRRPSRANQAAFDLAVAEVSAATRRLLDSVHGGERLMARSEHSGDLQVQSWPNG